jgi:ribonuclease HII
MLDANIVIKMEEIKEKKKRVIKEYHLLPYQEKDRIEIGIDEAGAGTFFGNLFIAGVILPQNFEELMKQDSKVVIRDSKKMSQKKREYAEAFIKQHALEWNIVEKTNEDVDSMNILRARLTGFHDVIRIMKNQPQKILVDGDKFNDYYNEDGNYIPAECVIEGDNKYLSIASASILAKTAQMRHIEEMVEKYPDLRKYDIQNNHGYGTLRHRNAIQEFGVTPYHRLSFGICKQFSGGRFEEKPKREENIFVKMGNKSLFEK